MNGFWEVAGTLAFAGIAGSLHCVGMCGPILLSFSALFDTRSRPAGRWTVAQSDPALSLTSRASFDAGRGRSLALDFGAYHAGRIWTYGMLGFLAGRVGAALRYNSAAFGWQRPAALAVGVAVVLGGLLVLGIVPRVSRWLSTECNARGFGSWDWFRALTVAPGLGARLVLGALMGLLPCGMVWAMLPVVATLPTPLHAAAGMVAFGLGTLPSLSAVIFAGRLWPVRLRRHGSRLVGATLVLTGCFMVARTLTVEAPTPDGQEICAPLAAQPPPR